MNIRLTAAFLSASLLACVTACIEPYEVRYQLNADLLSVDGFVSDQTGTTVSISKGRNVNQSFYSESVRGCVVEIRAGDGSSIALQEVAEGFYAAPAHFKGQIGQTYQLFFRTPEGKSYESAKEFLRASGEIKKVYQQYDPIGLLDKTGKNVLGSTVNVYFDIQDPKETPNSYLWRWKLYEEQGICITCYGGRLNPALGKCTQVISSPTKDYDYACDRQCWEIIYSKDVNILDDAFFNGKSVSGKLIAQIPFYSYRGSLLEIEQLGLSKEAYNYFRLLNSLVQNTGTLTDTPPAAIIGNIKNVNDPQEKIVGFFGAASIQKIRYWIERNQYPDPIVTTLLGHQINLDESPAPSFPCILSKDRTPIRPEGWQ